MFFGRSGEGSPGRSAPPAKRNLDGAAQASGPAPSASTAGEVKGKPASRPSVPGSQVGGGSGSEVVPGRAAPRQEARVNHGGATEVKATPLPERIPSSLSAPVRALAEAVLASNGDWQSWSDIPRPIQNVVRAYDTAHEQVCATSGMRTSEIQHLKESSAREFQNIMREIDTLRASGTSITDRLVELLTQLQEREAQVAADVAALVFLNTLLQDGTIRYFLAQMNNMSASLGVDHLLQQDTQYAQSRLQQTARALKQYTAGKPSETLTKLLGVLPNQNTYTELFQRLGFS